VVDPSFFPDLFDRDPGVSSRRHARALAGKIPDLCFKWSFLSEFIKEIEQRFFQYFNKNRIGFQLQIFFSRACEAVALSVVIFF
jgi:hypothetical protein